MLFGGNYMRNFKNRFAFVRNASLRIVVAKTILLLCVALGFVATHAQPSDSGAVKPAVDKPAADKPAVDKPAVDKPAADKPAVDKPAADKPAADKPAADKPAVDKPAVDKPAKDKPAKDKPAKDKPAKDKPAKDKPAKDKPAKDKPAADKPAADKPAADKPAADKPAADKPAADKPAAGEAVIDQANSDALTANTRQSDSSQPLQKDLELLSYMKTSVVDVSQKMPRSERPEDASVQTQVSSFLRGVECRLKAATEPSQTCSTTMEQLRTDHVATIRALTMQEGGQKFGLSTVVVTGCMSALLGGLLVGLFMWRFARPTIIPETVPRTDKLDLRSSHASFDAMRGNDPKAQGSTPPRAPYPLVPPPPVQPSPQWVPPLQSVQPRPVQPPPQQVPPMQPRPVPPPAQPVPPRSVQPPQELMPVKAFGIDDLLRVVRNNLSALVDSEFVRGDVLVAKMASELASSSVKFETWNKSYTRQDSSLEWCYLRCDANFTDGSVQSILCIAPGTKPGEVARAYFDGLDANLGMDAKVRRTQSPAILAPNSGGANPACLKKGTVEMKK